MVITVREMFLLISCLWDCILSVLPGLEMITIMELDISGGFKVNKIDPALVVDVKDIKVGENATISVNLDSDATGNATIMLDNQNYTVAINEGQAIKVIGGLKVGDYNVAVKYDGDNNYNAVNVNATLQYL